MLGLSQLNFDFAALPRWVPFRSVRDLPDDVARYSDTESAAFAESELRATTEAAWEGRDATLEEQTRALLQALGLPGGAKLVTVTWNARLRSTAGYARYPSWAVELNPRLREFEGQVDRTLKHELAHLIAYHRSGRRRIEPHGHEWRLACADLGIAGEKAHHRLPLPRKEVARRLTYVCPACQVQVARVHKFRRPTACLHCCNTHSNGKYDGRFRLALASQD